VFLAPQQVATDPETYGHGGGDDDADCLDVASDSVHGVSSEQRLPAQWLGVRGEASINARLEAAQIPSRSCYALRLGGQHRGTEQSEQRHQTHEHDRSYRGPVVLVGDEPDANANAGGRQAVLRDSLMTGEGIQLS
jgi:hypothetical protein